MNSLKSLLPFAICTIISLDCQAFTTLAGRIWNENSGGVYTFHVHLRIVGTPQPADSLYFDPASSGNWQSHPMNAFVRCDTIGNLTEVYYSFQQTYAPGSYTLALKAGKRMSGIENAPNSGLTDFGLKTDIVYDVNIPANSSGVSDSLYLEPEWNTISLNTMPMNFWDAEGDSIAWTIGSPMYHAGFQFPDSPGGGNLQINQTNNTISWDPQQSGAYNLPLIFYEYREVTIGNWVSLGSTTREILIDADNQVGIVPLHEIDFNIYPNPSADEIRFTGFADVTLMDMSGKTVVAAPNVNCIGIAELPEGVYTLYINHLTTRKIIIAR